MSVTTTPEIFISSLQTPIIAFFHCFVNLWVGLVVDFKNFAIAQRKRELWNIQLWQWWSFGVANAPKTQKSSHHLIDKFERIPIPWFLQKMQAVFDCLISQKTKHFSREFSQTTTKYEEEKESRCNFVESAAETDARKMDENIKIFERKEKWSVGVFVLNLSTRAWEKSVIGAIIP